MRRYPHLIITFVIYPTTLDLHYQSNPLPHAQCKMSSDMTRGDIPLVVSSSCHVKFLPFQHNKREYPSHHVELLPFWHDERGYPSRHIEFLPFRCDKRGYPSHRVELLPFQCDKRGFPSHHIKLLPLWRWCTNSSAVQEKHTMWLEWGHTYCRVALRLRVGSLSCLTGVGVYKRIGELWETCTWLHRAQNTCSWGVVIKKCKVVSFLNLKSMVREGESNLFYCK